MSITSVRPPLGLSVNITDASGATTQWHSQDRNPENRPRSLSGSSQRMQGFASAGMELSRRMDRDYVDIHLLDDVQITGDDGSTVYEGRVGALPRTVDTTHSIALQCAGWMAHARDRKLTEIYVDRDLSRWTDVSVTEQVGLRVAGYANFGPSVVQDTGTAVLKLALTGAWAAGGLPMAAAQYDAGSGNLIGSMYYAWTRGTNVSSGGDPNWTWMAKLTTSDTIASGQDTTADLQAAGPSTGTLTATVARRFAMLRFHYDVAGGTNGMEYNTDWAVAVYGDHGLTKQGTAPSGFYASDMLRHIFTTYCPLLNTTGITDTTYVIPHQVFRDPIDPYDAALEINKYHLWDLSVWEDKTVHYGPVDLTDYDWDVRLDDPGTSTTLQGDTSDDLANGVAVTYTNVATRRQDRLTPDDTAALSDTSVENPVNQHGYPKWIEYQISVPTTQDAAIQIGRAALAEFNAPKTPGSITIGPYVRDRAGHWQPYWKVRSGDRIAITSSTSLSDRPRLVAEAQWTQSAGGAGQVVVSVDKPPARLDAVIDRIGGALIAHNIA